MQELSDQREKKNFLPRNLQRNTIKSRHFFFSRPYEYADLPLVHASSQLKRFEVAPEEEEAEGTGRSLPGAIPLFSPDYIVHRLERMRRNKNGITSEGIIASGWIHSFLPLKCPFSTHRELETLGINCRARTTESNQKFLITAFAHKLFLVSYTSSRRQTISLFRI